MNIIITGASRGIGYETVKIFASNEGNTIFAVSRNKAKINELANICNEQQTNSVVIPYALDLSLENEIEKFAATLNKKVSTIDILINNAGYLVRNNIENISVSEIEQIFKVNSIAPMILVQKLLPLLKESEKAHVLNVSRMAGFQGSSKFPGLTAYSASKSAVVGFTECLAEELKETNIKVNALALGAVATEMLAEAFPGYEAPSSAKQMAQYFYEFALNGYKMFNGKILPVSSSTP